MTHGCAVVPPAIPVRERSAYATVAVVFAFSVLATLWFWWSMPSSMDMPMPGGWTMSMMWMVMPNQSWLVAAITFLAMWESMMVAMMLPSSAPMLLLYRRAAAFRGEKRVGLSTLAMACGYFVVWLGVGIAIYIVGLAIGAAAMRWTVVSRLVPIAGGATLIVCGLFQLTAWKSQCLRHCRDPLSMVAGHMGHRGGAWQLGLHHGLFCAICCGGLMIIQLVLGVMSLTAMVLVAVAIAVEKMAPGGERIARGIGVASILGGIYILARTLAIRSI